MNEYLLILKSNLESLEKAQQWLLISYDKCKQIDVTNNLSFDDLEALEALSSRFARLIDLLFQKVLRTIEEIELCSDGTLIDVIHRFQKRGFDIDEDRIRAMRGLRNLIAHEYIEELLHPMFSELISHVPYLNQLIQQTFTYTQRYLS
ncbi:MAG: hypothetical protein RBS43_11205 [Candidatus Cloacimonas sp.]|jgi:hypothetical protein|nr:hypothetical protein [Candidatus Cloacimonas sp.]